MRDDALDGGVVRVRGGGGRRQDEPRIENVQALVLHGAHVEVVHGDDVEQVEVVLQAEHLLVPPHALHERLHREVGFVEVVRLNVDAQRDVAAGHRRERVLHDAQVTRDEREQIRGLDEGVVPHREMPRVVPGDGPGVHQVAVGEEHRVLLLVRLDACGEHGHHVRPVLEERDAPEPLRLALRAEVPAGLVQTLQLGVLLRLDLRHHAKLERRGGRRQHG